MQNPYELDLIIPKEIDKILPKLLSNIHLSNINENPENNNIKNYIDLSQNNKRQKLNLQIYINHKKRKINED